MEWREARAEGTCDFDEQMNKRRNAKKGIQKRWQQTQKKWISRRFVEKVTVTCTKQTHSQMAEVNGRRPLLDSELSVSAPRISCFLSIRSSFHLSHTTHTSTSFHTFTFIYIQMYICFVSTVDIQKNGKRSENRPVSPTTEQWKEEANRGRMQSVKRVLIPTITCGLLYVSVSINRLKTDAAPPGCCRSNQTISQVSDKYWSPPCLRCPREPG